MSSEFRLHVVPQAASTHSCLLHTIYSTRMPNSVFHVYATHSGTTHTYVPCVWTGSAVDRHWLSSHLLSQIWTWFPAEPVFAKRWTRACCLQASLQVVYLWADNSPGNNCLWAVLAPAPLVCAPPEGVSWPLCVTCSPARPVPVRVSRVKEYSWFLADLKRQKKHTHHFTVKHNNQHLN